jgi:hypothetical protein
MEDNMAAADLLHLAGTGSEWRLIVALSLFRAPSRMGSGTVTKAVKDHVKVAPAQSQRIGD